MPLDRSQPEPAQIPNCRWIPLGHALFALVDEDQFEYLNKWFWYCQTRKRSKQRPYHCVARISEGRHSISMAREILGATVGQVVDHIDGNTLNNTRSNLRFASISQNSRNTRVKKTKKSHYKGVRKSRSAWKVVIFVNGIELYLGSFKSDVEAAKVYDNAARKYFGVFARLNFPNAGEQSAL